MRERLAEGGTSMGLPVRDCSPGSPSAAAGPFRVATLGTRHHPQLPIPRGHPGLAPGTCVVPDGSGRTQRHADAQR